MGTTTQELPKPFKTWVQLYQILEDEDLLKFETVTHEGGGNLLVSDVKQNALDELLAERMKYTEAEYFFNRVESMFRSADFERDGKTFKMFEQAKRIVLTQCSRQLK